MTRSAIFATLAEAKAWAAATAGNSPVHTIRVERARAGFRVTVTTGDAE
jgi:hypothetical protein